MSEFDTLLEIALLAIGIVGGYAAFKWAAMVNVIKTFLLAIQAIRAAKADQVVTDAEKIAIADAALIFEAAISTCITTVRR